MCFTWPAYGKISNLLKLKANYYNFYMNVGHQNLDVVKTKLINNIVKVGYKKFKGNGNSFWYNGTWIYASFQN